MSDLSNDEIAKVENFNAGNYVRSLCKNKKIQIDDYADIHFFPGWKSIVEDLIKFIGNYSVSLVQISDRYSQLDVEFNVINKTKELFVWEEIAKARRASRSICACCGKRKSYFGSKGSVNMLCEICTRGAGELKRTGTWLDKY